MDLALGPGKRPGVLVIVGDERLDVGLELVDRLERGALERLPAEDREPDIDMVEPRGVGWRVMEVDVRMAGQPHIAFRLVGREIVKNDADFAIWVFADGRVYEVEELDPPPPYFVTADDFASDVECGKQRCPVMPLVVAQLADHRSPASNSLARARVRNGRPLGDRKHHRVLWQRHVQPPISAALATNSGSLLSHQDLIPDKSTFWARRKRQIYCS